MQYSIFSTKLTRGLRAFGQDLWKMFREGDVRLLECVFAGLMMIWGAYLLLPTSWTSTDLHRASYAQVLPFSFWGGMMLSNGVALLISSVRNHYGWRRKCLFLTTMIFGGLWGVYYLAGRASVGLAILPYYLSVSALLYWRLRSIEGTGESAWRVQIQQKSSDGGRLLQP